MVEGRCIKKFPPVAKSPYEEILTDERKNTPNGNTIISLTVEQYYDLLHHSHAEFANMSSDTGDGTGTEGSTGSGTESSVDSSTIDAVIDVIAVLTSVVSDIGGDTSEVETMLSKLKSDIDEESGSTGSGDGSGDTGDSGDGGTSGDGGDDNPDTGDDEPSDEDKKLNEALPESSSWFSYTYDTSEESIAVATLDATMEDDPSISPFAVVLDDQDEISEYLGCYDLTADNGVSTLASPIAVDDPEVYSAIVLHYNTEISDWEEVSGVEIKDGYVYATFDDLSPVAVCTIRKKYTAEVNGTYYATLESAINAAETLAASTGDSVTVNLQRDLVVEDQITIVNTYSTAASRLYFDLNGHTIYGSTGDAYVISMDNEDSNAYVYIQNGTIECDENTVGAISINGQHSYLIDLNLTGSYKDSSVVFVGGVGAAVRFNGCNITATNCSCVAFNFDEVESLKTSYFDDQCKLVQTQTADNINLNCGIWMAGKNLMVYFRDGSSIDATEYGVINAAEDGIIIVEDDNTSIYADIAVYLTDAVTNEAAFVVHECAAAINGSLESDANVETGGFSLMGGIYDHEINDEWLAEDCKVMIEDSKWVVEVIKIFEYTDADGNISYSTTITDALVKACAGGTVKMLADYETDTGINIDCDITIDLGGYTFTSHDSFAFDDADQYNITIKNGIILDDSDVSATAGLKIRYSNAVLEDLVSRATEEGSRGLTMGDSNDSELQANVQITGNSEMNGINCGILIANRSTKNYERNETPSVLTIGDGVTIIGRDYAISGNGNYDNTVITIGAATIINNGDEGVGIYHPQEGTLELNGTTITGVNGIQICDGDVVINDATITATGEDDSAGKTGDGLIQDGTAISIINRTGYSDEYPTMEIHGGTFTSEKAESVKAYSWGSNKQSEWDNAGDYVKVMGGKFKPTISDALVSEGYTLSESPDDDGYYSVLAN